MRAIWLRNNPRVLLAALAPCLLAAALGAGLAAGFFSAAIVVRVVGGGLLILTLVPVAVLLRQLTVPRLAYRDDHLLVYLRWLAPVHVPVRVVECFLLGQAPAALGGRGRRREARAIIVRLAEKATEWARVDVQPLLGTWCGGQITLRGTWCEPLDVELVQRLNRQLAAAQRETQQREVA